MFHHFLFYQETHHINEVTPPCFLPPQVSDNGSSLSAVGRCGDGAAAVVWFYGGGEGLRVLEDLYGSGSCGSGSGTRDPERPEPPPGCC